jgi:pimeloyl-ACP methyl ester carboxylesterase
MEFDVNGARVFATTGGRDFDPDRPAVIFIHGASFDRTVWKLQTRYFAWHGYSVLALDLPGHGRSEGPLLTTIEEMADWIAAVEDAVGIDSAALVGHSLGALVALEAAARHPERVRALALLGCAFPMRVNDELLSSAKANEHLAMDLTNSWGLGRTAQKGVHRVPGVWIMRGGLRILEQSDEDVLFTDMNACNQYSDGEASAAKVSCPTRFILGTGDIMTPLKAARKFVGNFPDAEIVEIAGAGHMMMDQAPDETLDALRGFV